MELLGRIRIPYDTQIGKVAQRVKRKKSKQGPELVLKVYYRKSKVEQRAEILVSVVRIHPLPQHGDCSSIGRAFVCEAEGSRIETDLSH